MKEPRASFDKVLSSTVLAPSIVTVEHRIRLQLQKWKLCGIVQRTSQPAEAAASCGERIPSHDMNPASERASERGGGGKRRLHYCCSMAMEAAPALIALVVWSWRIGSTWEMGWRVGAALKSDRFYPNPGPNDFPRAKRIAKEIKT